MKTDNVMISEIDLDDDGYDAFGCYYGVDAPLFRVSFETHPDLDTEFRAESIGAAEGILCRNYPWLLMTFERAEG